MSKGFKIENPTDLHRDIWKWWSGWMCADSGMSPVHTIELMKVIDKHRPQDREQRLLEALKEIAKHHGDSAFDCRVLKKKADEALASYKQGAGEVKAPVVPDVAWKNVAMALGERLTSVGPEGYYDMTPSLWFEWALSTLGHREELPVCKCPECGSPEVDAMSPRTVYACGSSDYDARPGSFRKGDKCSTPPPINRVREAVEALQLLSVNYGGEVAMLADKALATLSAEVGK